MLLFISMWLLVVVGAIIFQYISCYCLSDFLKLEGNQSELFQYISCYCLSLPESVRKRQWTYFNTSHVTVYRFRFIPTAAVRNNFNTSHVTVYLDFSAFDAKVNVFQYISCYCLSTVCVSTVSWCYYFNTSHVTVYQLKRQGMKPGVRFQYISCYCLSIIRSAFSIAFVISIHLMLLFIS